MPSTPWWLLGLALLFFWAVGAYNRLAGLRREVLDAMAVLVPALGARRAAVMAWVASDHGDRAPIGGASAPQDDPAAEADPPAEAVLRRARAAQAVRHAADQAEAAASAAAARPLASGQLRSLSMAEEVFERAVDAWIAAHEAALQGASGDRPNGGPAGSERPAGLASVEFELAMVRQAFNLAVDRHNQALGLPPACWLAAAVGFRALATLQAGPSLAVAPAQAVGSVAQAVSAARAG